MENQLEIRLVHLLPGRIRVRLSHPLMEDQSILPMIDRHPGIDHVLYTAASGSLVMAFDPDKITTEEVILRVSLALSMGYDYRPVRVQSREIVAELSGLSVVAGFCLLFNHLFRLLAPGVGQSTALTAISGAATLAAVVEHGVEDIRARGQVHPEVLAVYYLIAAFLRGNVLKGATITWFLTYARHIVEKPSAYVVVKSKKTDPTCHIHRCDHQVTVSREEADKGFGRLLRLLPQIALSAYRQGNLNLEDSLFKQVQSIAESRHAVIDGLENLKQGIHLKVVV